MAETIDLAAWELLDRLLQRLAEGTLEPSEIPEPSVRTEHSDTLDSVERSLFESLSTGEDLDVVRRERGALRLARRLARDEIDQIAIWLTSAISQGPVSRRIAMLLEALRPTAVSNEV